MIQTIANAFTVPDIRRKIAQLRFRPAPPSQKMQFPHRAPCGPVPAKCAMPAKLVSICCWTAGVCPTVRCLSVRSRVIVI